MAESLLLMIRTALHRYVVRRDQVHELCIVNKGAELAATDERGRPLLGCELGPLLDPTDIQRQGRQHALVVQLRRRSIALLVNRVDDIYSQADSVEAIQPLPRLLMRRIERPWFLGVLMCDDTPVLVLDLRTLAQDAVLSQKDKA